MTATPPADRSAVAIRHVRIARPTSQLTTVVRFYTEHIGWPEIGRFQGHHGYDGVMVGLPGTSTHLEFTTDHTQTSTHAPTTENLLVVYLQTPSAVTEATARLRRHGHQPTALDNPYWAATGAVAFSDPDGWQVVFSSESRPTDEQNQPMDH